MVLGSDWAEYPAEDLVYNSFSGRSMLVKSVMQPKVAREVELAFERDHL